MKKVFDPTEYAPLLVVATDPDEANGDEIIPSISCEEASHIASRFRSGADHRELLGDIFFLIVHCTRTVPSGHTAECPSLTDERLLADLQEAAGAFF